LPLADFMRVRFFCQGKKRTCAMISCNFFEIHDIITNKYTQSKRGDAIMSIKLMVIGLDSVSLSLLEKYKHLCPGIHSRMRKGVYGHALPSFPVYTPTNWAVLCTGADTATNGAGGWFRRVDGKRLDTFDSRTLTCDTVFASAARNNIKTLSIFYPGAFPVHGESGMVLAPLDRGLVSNALVPGRIIDINYDENKCFDFPLLQPVVATTGAEAAKAAGATEDGAVGGRKNRKVDVENICVRLKMRDENTWTVTFDCCSNNETLLLTHEQWSKPIPIKVNTPGRPGNCAARIMIFDNGKRIAVSEAYDIGLIGEPEQLASAVLTRFGPPIEHSLFCAHQANLFNQGIDDPCINRHAEQELQSQVDWIIDAASFTYERESYEMFYLHYHYPDSVLHNYLAAAEGNTEYSKEQNMMGQKAIETSIRCADRLVNGLLELTDDNTVVVLVSDHGNAPNRYVANVNKRLVECGLMYLKNDGSIDRENSPVNISPMVRTWVDIKAPKESEEYHKLQSKVIDALLDWKTESGERVISVALRRKDSHLLGYYGSHCGDVTFHYNSGFGWGNKTAKSVERNGRESNHGPQMPVTFSKVSDNMAFFAVSGPGIKENLRWNEPDFGYIRLVDIVPTICEASGIPVPLNVTGAVRRELFKQVKEL